MPRRAIQPRFIARMHIASRTASPLFSARHQFQLDHTLRAQVRCHRSIHVLRHVLRQQDLRLHVLRRERHRHAHAFPQRFQDLRSAHHLRKMWRANFFFTFRNKNQIHRRLFPGSSNRMQGRQKCFLRSLLIHRATAHHHFAQPRFLDQRRFEWRRTPVRRIGLLHVVHKIETQRLRRSRVQRCKHTRLPVRRHLPHTAKSGLA